MQGILNPSPSPDDLSSPNPDQAAPLLQAQQRTPSRAEREEMRPRSGSGTGKMDAEITETEEEGIDIQGSMFGIDREQLEKDSEQDRKDVGEDKETADRETADEGLPPSKGSGDESEEESEGQIEPPDANNNSLEIEGNPSTQDRQEDLIYIQEAHAQVGLEEVSCYTVWRVKKRLNYNCIVFILNPSTNPSVLVVVSKAMPVEETYCSDEIEVVLVDNSAPGSASVRLVDSDTVKIIITMSCDPQTAALLEESVKQSLLENAQVNIISDQRQCLILMFSAYFS